MAAMGVNGGPFAKGSILGLTTQHESVCFARSSIASFPPRVSFRFAFDLVGILRESRDQSCRSDLLISLRHAYTVRLRFSIFPLLPFMMRLRNMRLH